MSSFIFTSESVTEGHPDKIADQISDSVLDAALKDDPKSRVACETFVTTGMVLVGGEITTETYIDIPELVRQTIKEIGYDGSVKGFDYKTCAVLSTIDRQSPDIAQGVNEGEGDDKEQGAGDQGMMFGYACNETAELMPYPISLAHKLSKRLTDVRKNGTLDYLRPDGKTQVSIKYENGKPVGIENVVLSTQHSEDVSQSQLRTDIKKHVFDEILTDDLDMSNMTFHINPTGKFVIGGPMGDAGLTGRKIIVDTYGGYYMHGGGAFSGKDSTKVDRSAAYYARYVAKNVVASGLADRCGIQVAYAIGVSKPVSVLVDTFGTGQLSDEEITKLVLSTFDFRPKGIETQLQLRRPIFRETAAYGHFGRSQFPWEKLDKVDQLKK
ncbi:MAG: methionine adenosyltransferase [Calditrichaeota bacterium]|nr:methionine adenosyltransferase [Calditrichota bacterium]